MTDVPAPLHAISTHTDAPLALAGTDPRPLDALHSQNEDPRFVRTARQALVEMVTLMQFSTP